MNKTKLLYKSILKWSKNPFISYKKCQYVDFKLNHIIFNKLLKITNAGTICNTSIKHKHINYIPPEDYLFDSHLFSWTIRFCCSISKTPTIKI